MSKVIQGFSLIELMIVISIISILSVIAIPSYQHYTARARFTEVILATEPYKIAVAIALQEGYPLTELSLGAHGIPDAPKSTKNLAYLHVINGIITAGASDSLQALTYILKPNADGSDWTVNGSCIKAGLCDA